MRPLALLPTNPSRPKPFLRNTGTPEIVRVMCSHCFSILNEIISMSWPIKLTAPVLDRLHKPGIIGDQHMSIHSQHKEHSQGQRNPHPTQSASPKTHPQYGSTSPGCPFQNAAFACVWLGHAKINKEVP